MHTTKDKLSAMTTLWLTISILMMFICLITEYALITLFCTMLRTMHYQDKWNEWNLYHADDADIKMWADMDRPE